MYKYWATEVWLVVDVPVTMHYKFQQSSPIYIGRYLRFRSLTECWLLQLHYRDRLTVQTVQKTEIRTGAVLGLVGTPVVVQRQVLGFDRAENCGSSAVAFL